MCGYELTPVPQGQCSECGFGYDLKAIRDVATKFARNQISSYENAITMAFAAMLCFGVMLLPDGARQHLGIILICIGILPAGRPQSWTAGSFLVIICSPLLGALVLATEIFDFAGMAFLGLSALAGLWQKSEWQYLPLSMPGEMKNRISCRRLIFRISLGLAAFTTLWRIAGA